MATFGTPSQQHTDSGALPSHQRPPVATEPSASLTRAIFGDEHEFTRHQRIRDALAAVGDVPGTGTTQAEQACDSYRLLKIAVDALGGSSRAIAVDERASYSLFDWAAVLAPRVLALLSGHLKLTVAAIEQLGDPSPFQQSCLEELDPVRATGVALFTELGHGTDAMHLETTATWEPQRRGFRLDSPAPQSVKFMPNVAAIGVAKTGIVVARLIVNGQDEGVWPFLMRLRTADRLTDGVEVSALPDAGFGLWMDHALTKFDGALLPESSLLGGKVAWFDRDGRFHCTLSLAQRFARTTSPLASARLCMSGAVMAAARAGMALTIGYAGRRVIGPNGRTMIAGDHVARHLVHAMAEVWAMTCLVNTVREHCARDDVAVEQVALWGMLVKPIASHTAWRSLEICRQRCAAQGILRANYLVDYIALCQGIMTAEGENWAMLGAAGRAVRRSGRPRLTGTNDQGARSWWHRLIAAVCRSGIVGLDDRRGHRWWHQLLIERERLLADGTESVSQPDCAAVELATAVTVRAAADALTETAKEAKDPVAQRVLFDLAAVYGLQQVKAHAGWFAAHRMLGKSRAARLDRELRSRVAAVEAHLPTLAQSFALPDLQAPIAGDYVARWIEVAGWQNAWEPASTTPVRNRPVKAGR
ncbi:acyl-CoA dehydrogenase family protein [Nocardia sp. CA-128927]|uniref:acyl-CoA dehydrogenase family protein n=1 Tax=Nocardia sp. CA-128927 TaxID=3239975 RepID=UPI003D981870